MHGKQVLIAVAAWPSCHIFQDRKGIGVLVLMHIGIYLSLGMVQDRCCNCVTSCQMLRDFKVSNSATPIRCALQVSEVHICMAAKAGASACYQGLWHGDQGE